MLSYLNEKNINLSTPDIEYHPLKPFVHDDTRVLFLGSFPPQRKRWCMDFFYPNYGNDHWRIMGIVFYDDKNHFVDESMKTFKIKDIVEHCKQYGIGYFDTAFAVKRLADNASDKFLNVIVPTDINQLIQGLHQLKAVVTTGTKATETICEQLGIDVLPKVGEAVEFHYYDHTLFLYRLPSSSRAYPLHIEKKAIFYKDMFKFMGMLES